MLLGYVVYQRPFFWHTNKEFMRNVNYKGFKDKRYFPRWQVERRLVFHQDHKPEPNEAKVLDLSCSGVRFQTDEEVILGQKVKLKLYFSLDYSIDLTGDVLWINTVENGFKQAGIRFYEASQENKDAILEHAFEFDKEKTVKNWFKGWAD